MLLFDHTFNTPEENLAADEALLEHAESGACGEVLRFWESLQHFVTLGYTNKRALEADVQACDALGVPILRRASGGGTVLQGPCSWNYGLVLDIEARPEIGSITSSNAWIMEQQARSVSQVLGHGVEVSGHTDLALDGRKFSGNAQKRKRRFTLFHGTILLRGFDLQLLAQTLQTPERQPNYRGERSHLDFVCTLDMKREDLKSALASTWGAASSLGEDNFPHAIMQRLIQERYSVQSWKEKF